MELQTSRSVLQPHAIKSIYRCQRPEMSMGDRTHNDKINTIIIAVDAVKIFSMYSLFVASRNVNARADVVNISKLFCANDGTEISHISLFLTFRMAGRSINVSALRKLVDQ